MTTNELTDNLAFLSSLHMLEGLVEQGLLTEPEAVRAKSELKRKLRPTLLIT